ncbi:MAG TPA: glycosyltransferase family 2 protein [Anaerolineae bacterium]|nr:glycosyltransferase family 2 protein [Anaerolineae bacterium]
MARGLQSEEQVTESQGSSPTVSVVMPTYNRGHLLPPVVESILSQDFQDLELVIVDDGSTDDTAAVVRQIQTRDPRVRYVPLPENRGVGFARDAGLRYAPGKYIALADSDDIWLPGRLREQVEILERHPEIDILFGDFWNIDHLHGTKHRAFERSPTLRQVVARPIEDGLFLIQRGMDIEILKSNFIATPTMVLRRQVFDRVGGFVPYLKSPDLDFCWRAAVLGARYAYLDRPLIERHVYSDSLTAQGGQPYLDQLEALDVMGQTCWRLGRQDLLPHIHAAKVQTYRALLRIYGGNRQRAQVTCTFIKSLRCGVSVRTLVWFLAALLGPWALASVETVAKMRGNLTTPSAPRE